MIIAPIVLKLCIDRETIFHKSSLCPCYCFNKTAGAKLMPTHHDDPVTVSLQYHQYFDNWIKINEHILDHPHIMCKTSKSDYRKCQLPFVYNLSLCWTEVMAPRTDNLFTLDLIFEAVPNSSANILLTREI